MKQKKSIVIETQTWTLEGLIDIYDDMPIQDVINKLHALMNKGYTHVRGEPKLMYYDPHEDSLAHEIVDEIIFSNKQF